MSDGGLFWDGKTMRLAASICLIVALVLGGCSGGGDPEAPPRATSVPQFEARNSTLVVPIGLSLDNLQAALERKAPHKLWSIDKRNQKCVSGAAHQGCSGPTSR
jgi:hypothetical protein